LQNEVKEWHKPKEDEKGKSKKR